MLSLPNRLKTRAERAEKPYFQGTEGLTQGNTAQKTVVQKSRSMIYST